MSSLNSRLKQLGFAKRKSSASIQSPDLSQSQSHTPPPQGSSQSSTHNSTPPSHVRPAGQAPSIASNSSQQSLPQMNHPGQGQRPPSYTAGYPGGSPSSAHPRIHSHNPPTPPPPALSRPPSPLQKTPSRRAPNLLIPSPINPTQPKPNIHRAAPTSTTTATVRQLNSLD